MTEETPFRGSSSPSTREGWLRDFALELRVRGVDGAQIGDALAVVESHCDDSGEEPQEAFGEPIAYADTLDFAVPPTHWTNAVILPVLGLVVGVNLALGAVLNWSAGVSVTVGLLASLLVFVAFAAMLVAFLRPVLTSKRALVAWFGAGFVLMVALPLVLRYELMRIPSVAAFVVGLIFVAVGIGAVRRIPSDPIVDPRERH